MRLTPDSILTWSSNLPDLSAVVLKSPKGVRIIRKLSGAVVPDIFSLEVSTTALSAGVSMVMFELVDEGPVSDMVDMSEPEVSVSWLVAVGVGVG